MEFRVELLRGRARIYLGKPADHAHGIVMGTLKRVAPHNAAKAAASVNGLHVVQ
jgi:hypothetical protein